MSPRRRQKQPKRAGGPAGNRTIELEITDIREIERVVELVRGECEAMRYAARQLMLNVPVALTEALSNAILRGNAQDPSKRVRITVQVDASRLVVEVEDEGEAFDLAACTLDPTTADRLTREDGRGLFLMQKLMDRVERIDGRSGNIVRLMLVRAS